MRGRDTWLYVCLHTGAMLRLRSHIYVGLAGPRSSSVLCCVGVGVAMAIPVHAHVVLFVFTLSCSPSCEMR